MANRKMFLTLPGTVSPALRPVRKELHDTWYWKWLLWTYPLFYVCCCCFNLSEYL